MHSTDHGHHHHHHHHDDEVRTVYSAYSPDHDHVHDDVALSPLQDNPIWQQDNVTLHSVGMDIGSSGTQVVFSRLHLRRIGEELTSRYIVVRRETVFRSPVELTPYASAEHIDAEELGSIIDRAYGAATVDPADIDTGVVILTGEALRRMNAEAIAEVLAERGGELVTATAGHNMEAMLAAYGSGAARRSYDTGKRILNVDIGGGTTKLAVLENGRILTTAAVHIGGRLQVTDGADRIIRLDPAGRDHAARAGFNWDLGDTARADETEIVAETMADALVRALTCDPLPADIERLYLTDPLAATGPVEGVMFSGGVAEYVYGRESEQFGDLGGLSGVPCAGGWTAVRCRFRSSTRVNACAPRRSVRRSTASSSAGTPATSRAPTHCCRAATSRSCGRPTNSARPSTPRWWHRPSVTTSWLSTSHSPAPISPWPCPGPGCRATTGSCLSRADCGTASRSGQPGANPSMSCSTGTSP